MFDKGLKSISDKVRCQRYFHFLLNDVDDWSITPGGWEKCEWSSVGNKNESSRFLSLSLSLYQSIYLSI